MATAVPQTQIPGVFHRRSRRHCRHRNRRWLSGRRRQRAAQHHAEDATEILTANYRPARRTNVNCFLIHSKGRTALIETGCGTYMQETGGQDAEEPGSSRRRTPPTSTPSCSRTCTRTIPPASLTERLASASLTTPSLSSTKMSRSTGSTMATSPAQPSASAICIFKCAREQIAPYMDRLKPFTCGEVFPGVTAIPRPGHTPGHTNFLIESGDRATADLGRHRPRPRGPDRPARSLHGL